MKGCRANGKRKRLRGQTMSTNEYVCPQCSVPSFLQFKKVGPVGAVITTWKCQTCETKYLLRIVTNKAVPGQVLIEPKPMTFTKRGMAIAKRREQIAAEAQHKANRDRKQKSPNPYDKQMDA